MGSLFSVDMPDPPKPPEPPQPEEKKKPLKMGPKKTSKKPGSDSSSKSNRPGLSGVTVPSKKSTGKTTARSSLGIPKKSKVGDS